MLRISLGSADLARNAASFNGFTLRNLYAVHSTSLSPSTGIAVVLKILSIKGHRLFSRSEMGWKGVDLGSVGEASTKKDKGE